MHCPITSSHLSHQKYVAKIQDHKLVDCMFKKEGFLGITARAASIKVDAFCKKIMNWKHKPLT